MDIVAQEKKNNKRYLPHTVSTKEGAVKLYRQTKDIDFVLRRYHISKASLMRWNRLYDGTRESLFEREGAASASAYCRGNRRQRWTLGSERNPVGLHQ